MSVGLTGKLQAVKHNSIIEGGLLDSVVGIETAQIDYTRAQTSIVKRVLDIVLSISLLVFIAPVLLVVALLIKLEDGGPVLFGHKRRGLRGETFKCYKFRSMVKDAEGQLNALLESDPVAAEEWRLFKKVKNDPRVTRIGKFLRKSSLDELPQILNILSGDMSIVGPRPITDKEVPDYGVSSDFDIYCSVRPGVLGLWQVSGRSDTNFERRVQLDTQYARTWNIWRDFEIMLKAIPVVLFGKGAY